MESKKVIMLFVMVGGAIGGYIPVLWGGSTFSLTSIILSAVGGFAGIYIGYKISE